MLKNRPTALGVWRLLRAATQTFGQFRTIVSVLCSVSLPPPSALTDKCHCHFAQPVPFSHSTNYPCLQITISSIITPNYPSKFAIEFFIIGLVKNGFLSSSPPPPHESIFVPKLWQLSSRVNAKIVCPNCSSAHRKHFGVLATGWRPSISGKLNGKPTGARTRNRRKHSFHSERLSKQLKQTVTKTNNRQFNEISYGFSEPSVPLFNITYCIISHSVQYHITYNITQCII